MSLLKKPGMMRAAEKKAQKTVTKAPLTDAMLATVNV